MIQNPRARRYYEKHREEILAKKKAAYWADPAPERARTREKASRLMTPEKIRSANSRRKAKSAGAVGTHSLKEWNRLVARYRGRCAYCAGSDGWTRDHVIPVSRGGSDFIGNILPACLSCNASKQDKFLTEWKLWQRRRVA